MTTRTRAEPMSPEERRKAIVEAIIPLLREHGANTTTRQMAEACGVAEGTLFRVFEDKAEMVLEAIRHSLDPAPTERSLTAIDPSLSYPDQLLAAGRILADRNEELMALFSVMRSMPHKPNPAGHQIPSFIMEAQAAITAALTRFFERHQAHLATPPELAATAFRSLLFGSGHPIVGSHKMSLPEILDVLHNGIGARREAMK